MPKAESWEMWVKSLEGRRACQELDQGQYQRWEPATVSEQEDEVYAALREDGFSAGTCRRLAAAVEERCGAGGHTRRVEK